MKSKVKQKINLEYKNSLFLRAFWFQQTINSCDRILDENRYAHF